MERMLTEGGGLKQRRIELVYVEHFYCACLSPTFCYTQEVFREK